MSTATLPFPALVGHLRQRIEEEDATLADLVEELHREIGSDPAALKGFWETAGARALESLLRPHLMRAGVGKGAVHRSGVPAPRPSWRAELRPEDGLDMQLPIQGRMVAVRDLTPRDIGVLVETYRGLVAAVTVRAEQWARIKRALAPDDTIGSALEAGRLQESQLQFIAATDQVDRALLEGEGEEA